MVIWPTTPVGGSSFASSARLTWMSNRLIRDLYLWQRPDRALLIKERRAHVYEMQAKAGRPLFRVLITGFERYANRLKAQGCPVPQRVDDAVYALLNALEYSVNAITDRMEGEPPSSDDRTADRYAAERRRLPRSSGVHTRIAPGARLPTIQQRYMPRGIPYCASTHSGGPGGLLRLSSHLPWPPHRQDVGKRGRYGAQCGHPHGGLCARGLSLVGGVHDRHEGPDSPIAALRLLWTTRRSSPSPREPHIPIRSRPSMFERCSHHQRAAPSPLRRRR